MPWPRRLRGVVILELWPEGGCVLCKAIQGPVLISASSLAWARRWDVALLERILDSKVVIGMIVKQFRTSFRCEGSEKYLCLREISEIFGLVPIPGHFRLASVTIERRPPG